MFRKATKTNVKLRLAIQGPSGAGKTYTALLLATELVAREGGRIAVIDTEHGSASRYADEFDFDVLELTDYHPDRYIEAMREAHKADYTVLIIDSLSHAWEAVLQLVDDVAKRNKGNSFSGWREGTPVQNAFIGAMLKYGGHLIATMRSKTEYVIETTERGKQQPRKVGMAPVQRAGVEYEFDVVLEMDHEHNAVVTKTRCRALDRVVARNADGIADSLHAWLTSGAPVEDAPLTFEKPNSDGQARRTRMLLKIIDMAAEVERGGGDVSWIPDDAALEQLSDADLETVGKRLKELLTEEAA